MLLQSTSDTIRTTLSGEAAPAGQPASVPSASVFTAFSDLDPILASATPTSNNSTVVLNAEGTTTVVGPPPTGKTRTINFFSIVNLDPLKKLTVTITYTNVAGVVTTLKNAVVLLTGETLQYALNSGFQILDINGFIKFAGADTDGDDDSTESGSEAVVDSAATGLMIVKLLARLLGVDEGDVIAEMRDPSFTDELETIPG